MAEGWRKMVVTNERTDSQLELIDDSGSDFLRRGSWDGETSEDNASSVDLLSHPR